MARDLPPLCRHALAVGGWLERLRDLGQPGAVVLAAGWQRPHLADVVPGPRDLERLCLGLGLL
eukprot:5231094-Pyramimonas_sp.AAC.1